MKHRFSALNYLKSFVHLSPFRKGVLGDSEILVATGELTNSLSARVGAYIKWKLKAQIESTNVRRKRGNVKRKFGHHNVQRPHDMELSRKKKEIPRHIASVIDIHRLTEHTHH